MSDLYSVNEATQTLTTSTCKLVGEVLHTNENEYEVIIADLCRCMLQAIASDDAQGKWVIGVALHSVLGSVLSS